MGLFSKKKTDVAKKGPFENVPLLPSLPKLPDFPRLEESDYGNSLGMSRLPSFPPTSLGSKFSQDTIKEAVSGEEEMDSEDENADADEGRMMQAPLRKPMAEEMSSMSSGTRFASMRQREEPVFIRIDKFEEAMKVFNDAKRKISDMERILDEVKVVREREDKELQSWENEIKSMKDQVSKVEREIFSKI